MEVTGCGLRLLLEIRIRLEHDDPICGWNFCRVGKRNPAYQKTCRLIVVGK